MANYISYDEWSDFLATLETEPQFPPSVFTWFLALAGMQQLSQRLRDGHKVVRVAELGAKEGALGLWFAKMTQAVVATEVEVSRLDLLRRNIARLGCNNVQVAQSSRGIWFPKSVDWKKVDLILCNPPSLPEPTQLPDLLRHDRSVWFSGKDGRTDARLIVRQSERALGATSQLILVGADYVLDPWLHSECTEAGLVAQEIMRRSVKSQRGQPEWELREHIQYMLGWDGFKLATDSLFFDQVAFLISRK